MYFYAHAEPLVGKLRAAVQRSGVHAPSSAPSNTNFLATPMAGSISAAWGGAPVEIEFGAFKP